MARNEWAPSPQTNRVFLAQSVVHIGFQKYAAWFRGAECHRTSHDATCSGWGSRTKRSAPHGDGKVRRRSRGSSHGGVGRHDRSKRHSRRRKSPSRFAETSSREQTPFVSLGMAWWVYVDRPRNAVLESVVGPKRTRGHRVPRQLSGVKQPRLWPRSAAASDPKRTPPMSSERYRKTAPHKRA